MAQKKLEKFEKYLSKADFGFATPDVVAQPGAYTRIGEVEIGAQTIGTFGAGAISNGVDFRRTATIHLKTAADADIDDMRVRLVLTNAQETRRQLVAEELSQVLRTGILLGEYPTKAVERDKLVIEVFNSTAAAITIGGPESSIAVPTTIYQ